MKRSLFLEKVENKIKSDCYIPREPFLKYEPAGEFAPSLRSNKFPPFRSRIPLHLTGFHLLLDVEDVTEDPVENLSPVAENFHSSDERWNAGEKRCR